MQKRTLIVGAGGQVGTALAQHLGQRNGPASLLLSSRSPRQGWLQLDLANLRNESDLAVIPGLDSISEIVCVAAFTHVDGCEGDPAQAFQVNAHAPAILAAHACRRRIPFVYFSTDYLFDGSEANPGPYRESSPVHPINVYGASKLAGEQGVLAAHPGALILRTAGVYGPDDQGKNYLYTVLRSLAMGRPLRVPLDQISTPTCNADLASAAAHLLRHGVTGVVHVCGPQVMGRLQLAAGIAAAFDLNPAPLQGVLTSDLGQRATRPLRAGLQSDRLLPGLLPAPMRSLQQALADCKPVMQRHIATWQAQAKL